MARVVFKGTNLDKLKVSIRELGKFKLMVGWLESAMYDDGTPVAGIAAVQEFGSPSRNVPPRPFMRPAISGSKSKWRKLVEKSAKSIIEEGDTAESAVEKLGLVAAANIKNEIVQGSHEPLSPVTIALRKHKNEGKEISGTFVGQVAAAIARGETGPGELGDQSFKNQDPLRNTGVLIATLTHEYLGG